MKKIVCVLLTAVLMLSLAACGSSKPGLEEVEKAITEGTITVDDAFEKGWVTEEWMAERDAKSIPAANKRQSNMIEDFLAKTIEGADFTKADLSPVTFITFLDPETEAGKEQYQTMASTYKQVVANNGDVLVISMSENGSDLFADAAFPVVFYNDSINEALGSLSEMVDGTDFIGSWNITGAFMSAWYGSIEAEDWAESAASFSEMADTYSDSDDAAMVPMS